VPDVQRGERLADGDLLNPVRQLAQTGAAQSRRHSYPLSKTGTSASDSQYAPAGSEPLDNGIRAHGRLGTGVQAGREGMTLVLFDRDACGRQVKKARMPKGRLFPRLRGRPFRSRWSWLGSKDQTPARVERRFRAAIPIGTSLAAAGS
jgi:hypothetical protein